MATPEPDWSWAQGVCRRHAKSFYFASHVLPRPKRLRAYAVYSFCRFADDTVDLAFDRSGADLVAEVARLKSLLDAIYGEGPLEDRRFEAFRFTVRDCSIEKSLFHELLDGISMDLVKHRYRDWPELETYCYKVASVVGLMMCGVFGVSDPEARRHAVAMGTAMQLTNILRDVKEDLDRGRVYLPREDLDRFGVSEADLTAGRVTPGFQDLMRFEIARAWDYYRQGEEGLRFIPDDGSRYCARTMALLYSRILNRIEARRYDVFSGRASVSKAGKLWLVLKDRFGGGVPLVPPRAD